MASLHFPEWAEVVYTNSCDEDIAPVTSVVFVDFGCAFDDELLNCMRSQLVGEFLEREFDE